jgi:hypothetical protein
MKQPKPRQTHSEYSKRYDNKRQAHSILIKLYADDEMEKELITKIDELKAKKQLKTAFIQAFTDFFRKNE